MALQEVSENTCNVNVLKACTVLYYVFIINIIFLSWPAGKYWENKSEQDIAISGLKCYWGRLHHKMVYCYRVAKIQYLHNINTNFCQMLLKQKPKNKDWQWIWKQRPKTYNKNTKWKHKARMQDKDSNTIQNENTN